MRIYRYNPARQEFYAVNKSFPEEEYSTKMSRKINADIFIDDRNIGGVLGWGEVYQMLTNGQTEPPKERKGILRWFR